MFWGLATLHVFHGEQQPLVTEVLQLVDLDDVGMVQAGGEPRFLDEHGPKAPRPAVRRQDALEDQDLVGPLCSRLFREEHLGHATGAQAPHDLELRNLAGCGRRQGLGHVRR